MKRLENIQDALDLFRDLTTKEVLGSYTGIEFRVYYHGTNNILLALLLWGYYAIAERLIYRSSGHYITFVFPESIGLDLNLIIRNGRNRSNADLRIKANLSAIDKDAVEKLLSQTQPGALQLLGEKYNLDLNDFQLKIGPLLGDPTENAQTLHLAAEFVKDLLAAKKIKIKYRERISLTDKLVEVTHTTNKIEAQIYRSMLDSADIPCILDGMQDASPWGAWTMASTGKIHVFVRDEDLVSAKKVLKHTEEDKGI